MSAFDPITQERVYHAVKGDYLAGIFQQGMQLDIQGIADRHGASKTPVREAVHRLMGERLVEPDPKGGFRIPHLGPDDLIHIYAWNAHLLLSITHSMKASVLRQTLDRFAALNMGDTPLALVSFTGAIFTAFAETSGNSEATATIGNINERLLYSRIAETTDINEAARELRTLTNSAVADVQKNVRRRIESYHVRKIERQQRLKEENQR